MSDVRWLNRTEVASLLTPERLRPALEAAVVALVEGKADVPPRIAAVGPKGLLATMPGHLDGIGMAAKIVSVFAGSDPSHQGVVVVVGADNGRLLSIMDAEVLTERRTAMTAAIAADLLARADAEVLTIVGAGAQGQAHLDTFGSLRTWREIRIVSRTRNRSTVRIVSRTRNRSTVLAANARSRIGAEVAIADFDGFEEAVVGADVVTLCTHADAPVIEAGWVKAGAHVSSVGSLAELPSGLVGLGIVVDQLGAVTAPPPAGAIELQGLDPSAVIELGTVVADPSLGRGNDDQLTVYKSTGHAVQDIAAARVVLDAAVEAGVGTLLPI